MIPLGLGLGIVVLDRSEGWWGAQGELIPLTEAVGEDAAPLPTTCQVARWWPDGTETVAGETVVEGLVTLSRPGRGAVLQATTGEGLVVRWGQGGCQVLGHPWSATALRPVLPEPPVGWTSEVRGCAVHVGDLTGWVDLAMEDRPCRVGVVWHGPEGQERVGPTVKVEPVPGHAVAVALPAPTPEGES